MSKSYALFQTMNQNICNVYKDWNKTVRAAALTKYPLIVSMDGQANGQRGHF